MGRMNMSLPKKPEGGGEATIGDVSKMEEEKITTEEIVEQAEEKLVEKTAERLEQTFSGKGLEEEPAEEPAEEPESPPDDEQLGSSAEKDKDKDDDEPADKDDSTPEPKDKKDKDVELKAKDVDADKDIPQLSDAYYRAAIHRKWKPEQIEEFYKANPELCVQTCGNIYEALKRSNEEFATLGRAYKDRKAQEAAVKATPLKTETEAAKTEYKGVDFVALEKTDIDPDAIAVIKAQDQQNKLLFDQIQELRETRPVQTVEQPSGPTRQESRVATQEVAVIQQQIENFFNADEVKLYKDFYGEVKKDAVDWSALSPGQKANRWAVVEMMDDLLTGAHINNRDMKIDEAMRLAHLNVSESQREKVIREKLKVAVVKRNKGLSLQPSSTNRGTDAGSPKTEAELLLKTADRLNKLFG